jgi:threonine dehydrogenase-like Zn-dependent dehydrogenase
MRCLKAQGVGHLICCEPATLRAEGAKTAGADLVLDPIKEDAVKTILAQYPDGVDVSFDCAGAPSGASLNNCLHVTQRKGTVVNVAMHATKPPVDITTMSWSEQRIQGIMAYTPTDYEEVIAALGAGKINVEGVITSRLPLADTEKGFHELIEHKDQHIKILLVSRFCGGAARAETVQKHD